jgi:hypothetical protein
MIAEPMLLVHTRERSNSPDVIATPETPTPPAGVSILRKAALRAAEFY